MIRAYAGLDFVSDDVRPAARPGTGVADTAWAETLAFGMRVLLQYGHLRLQLGVFNFQFGIGCHVRPRLGVVDLVSSVLVGVDHDDL